MGDGDDRPNGKGFELNNIQEDLNPAHELSQIVLAKSKEQVQDIYRKVFETIFSQKSRKGPATLIMALSMILVVCGILMAIIVGIFNSSQFVEAVKPLRSNKALVVSVEIILAAVTFITGIWGIASYLIKNKIFIAILGALYAFLVVIHGGCSAIFTSLSNLRDEDMQALCPVKKLSLDF